MSERKNKLSFKFDLIRCTGFEELKQKIASVLEKYSNFFPKEKNALILLKPNFNSNMNALTGNTTDLRIISAVIVFLKDKGYTNIVIGEGTNGGFYRNKIGVFSRLGVDRLAQYYGVTIKDLNAADGREIDFENGTKALVAKQAFDAELFINMPKLKTHFENGMSSCLKNLIGCLIGQDNKKKTHENLPENILRINYNVKPHIHIVDALIAMEGLGPSKGTPVRMDTVLVGTDPYLIDLICAYMANFNFRKVKTLALAEKKGILTQEYINYADSLDLSDIKKDFAPPEAGKLATFIHNPKRHAFFLKIRKTAFFTHLASTDWFGKFLFMTDLRQDVFLKEEMACKKLSIDKTLCDGCGICKKVCPLGIDLPDDMEKMYDVCIQCMYCYSACPKQAIKFQGKTGFFGEQIKQYGEVIKHLYE